MIARLHHVQILLYLKNRSKKLFRENICERSFLFNKINSKNFLTKIVFIVEKNLL